MIWMFLTGCAVVVACAVWLFQRICAFEYRETDRLDSEFQKLNARIEELSGAFAFAQLPESRKQAVRFEKLPAFTLDEARALKPGSVISMVSLEYDYPFKDPLITEFDYKHDRITEDESDSAAVEVHGSQRYTVDSDWNPCSFRASKEGSRGSYGTGFIKRGRVAGDES